MNSAPNRYLPYLPWLPWPLAAAALVGIGLLNLPGAVPEVVTYQGRVNSGATPFSGIGQFKFAIGVKTNRNSQPVVFASISGGAVTAITVLRGGSGYATAPAVSIASPGPLGTTARARATITGGSVTSISMLSGGSGYLAAPAVSIAAPPINNDLFALWSHDGSAGLNAEPVTVLPIAVSGGVFVVPLGDDSLSMPPIDKAALLGSSNTFLRVWFNDGTNGLVLLQPDHRLTASPYAVLAGGVPPGSLTASSLADNSVTSSKLANAISLGDTDDLGILRVYGTAGGDPAIILTGSNATYTAYANFGGTPVAMTRLSLGELRLSPVGIGGGAELLGNQTEPELNLFGVGNERRVQLKAMLNDGGLLELFTENQTRGLGLISPPSGGRMTTYDEGNRITSELGTSTGAGGFLNVRNGAGTRTVQLDGTGDGENGVAQVFAENGQETVRLAGAGGTVTLRQPDGSVGATLAANYGTGGGAVNVFQDNGTFAGQITIGSPAHRDGFVGMANGGGQIRALMRGSNPSGSQGGYLELISPAGVVTVSADSSQSGAGNLVLRNSSGGQAISLQGAEAAGNGGQITIYDSAGAARVVLDAEEGTSAGALRLLNPDGTTTIKLEANASGEGRITTEVLTITGGADLSEQFEIKAGPDTLAPGFVVSIDPANPGDLIVSRRAYDRTVAGIVSGAGGVKPGMLMGQVGTKASGRHPVALTGRVYCWVDATAGGAVVPGDLLTTSDTPGHAMRVVDAGKATGAIIGKAMTPLEKGRGLVLVLVSLQ